MMIVPHDDPFLSVEQARRSVAAIPSAVLAEVDARGHVAPLFAHADELAAAIEDFWADPRRSSASDPHTPAV